MKRIVSAEVLPLFRDETKWPVRTATVSKPVHHERSEELEAITTLVKDALKSCGFEVLDPSAMFDALLPCE